MGRRMPPEAKATVGLRLLKESVLETIKEKPAGATEVEKRLDIKSCNSKGKQKGWLAKSILWMLEREGRVKQIAPRKGYRATGK